MSTTRRLAAARRPTLNVACWHIASLNAMQRYVRSWSRTGSSRTTLETARLTDVWSGRALQVVSPSWRQAVLHQCTRPLIGVFALSHDGYQRACVLIGGQASSRRLAPGIELWASF